MTTPDQISGVAELLKPLAEYLGTLYAGAHTDYEQADPSWVGLDGVPIKIWRGAYTEGIKDTAEGILARLPDDQREAFKSTLLARYEAERLANQDHP